MTVMRRALNFLDRMVTRTEQGFKPAMPVPTLPLAFSHGDGEGSIDAIEGAPLPLVRVFGWFSGAALPPIALTTEARQAVSPLVMSRMRHHDAVATGKCPDLFCGFRIDFLLDAGERPDALWIGDRRIHALAEPSGYASVDPHYRAFFTQDKVMGRESVYGSGPPTDVSEEFKAFALTATGRVLDFGCGNGDVVAFLRGHGRDAVGIELDEARIRQSLKPEAAPHVQLYPGGIPMPFEAGHFDWIVSTEVIEHIADIGRYVAEFARLLKPGGKLLVTTPDITAIPSSFPANCVPWHLLEATHVNFFTPRSVAALFASAFALESTYCLGATRINGLYVPGSVGAVLVKKTQA